jgi:hypothetical protein
MKEGAHDLSPAGRPRLPALRVTVSQLGSAEFVNGDDDVTVALDANAEKAG